MIFYIFTMMAPPARQMLQVLSNDLPVSGLQAAAVMSLAWAALVPMRRRQKEAGKEEVPATTPSQQQRPQHYCYKTGVGVALPSAGWMASGVVLLGILICLSPTGMDVRASIIAPSLSVLLWRTMATILSWSTIQMATRHSVPALTRGGPLGLGCSKVWEALVGIWMCHHRIDQRGWSLPLLSFRDHQGSSSLGSGARPSNGFNSHPPPSTFLAWGKPIASQPWTVWVGLTVLCLAVNGVLWTWSIYHTSGVTGRRRNSTKHQKAAPVLDHPGVVHMVQDSVGRSLTTREHLQVTGLAWVNAVCEEVSFRGVYRWHFATILPWSLTPLWHSNVCQATIFGIWHYHGIPSGLVGVGLTLVYGIIMGCLTDYNEGLGLAIVAHTLADYYIFATIARQQQQQPPPSQQGAPDKQK